MPMLPVFRPDISFTLRTRSALEVVMDPEPVQGRSFRYKFVFGNTIHIQGESLRELLTASGEWVILLSPIVQPVLAK
jgi:hypothetical protein